jgi:hypothetical protein
MRKNFTHILFSLTLMAVLFYSGTAKADINYTFFKVQCDKTSHILRVRIPLLDKDEDPETIIAKIRSGQISDMYYFNDLASSGRTITCDLESYGTASFNANQNLDHPRNDNLSLTDSSGNRIGIWLFNTGGKSLEIHALGSNTYDIAECGKFWSGDPAFKGGCKSRHVVNGKITEESQHQATKE